MSLLGNLGPRRAVFLLAILSASACQESITGPKVGRVRSGTWGSDEAGLSVSVDGATAQFNCGSGRIGQPLLVDSRGRFDVPGIYFVTAGPGNGNPRQARFTGRANDNTLELSVQLLDTGQVLGPFSLSFSREFFSACV